MNIAAVTPIRFILLLGSIVFVQFTHGQADTIHLYYQLSATQLPDTTETKLANWAKSLNKQQTYVDIIAYYETNELKKVAQERLEEVNLLVIRKARDFTTIGSSKIMKGSKSQRSTVDIIYSKGDKAPMLESKKVATEKTKEKSAEPKKKEGGEKSSSKEGVSKNSKASENNTKEEGYYIYDTVFINGAMKVNKIKVKGK